MNIPGFTTKALQGFHKAINDSLHEGTDMRTIAMGMLVTAALGLTACSKSVATAGTDWMLRQESSSFVCHVQLKTASPLGSDLAGPFPNRKAACTEAANRYEAATTDSSKCGAYGKGTVDGCAIDGVTLPPN